MGLLDKAKNVAEQATTKAREGVAEVQTRRELAQAYDELGKTAFELVEGGELSHQRLAPAVERIRALTAEVERGRSLVGRRAADWISVCKKRRFKAFAGVTFGVLCCEAAWDLIFARARVAGSALRSGLRVPCRLSALARRFDGVARLVEPRGPG